MIKEEKKARKVKMQELFVQLARFLETTINLMSEGIYSLIEDKKVDVDKACRDVIKEEQKADRVFEQISARLFTREVMTFSRSDRLYLAKHIDTVLDAAERVARRMTIHYPKLYPELNDMLKKSAEISKLIGNLLTGAIIKIFDDFDATEKLVDDIQNHRREARDIEYKFLQVLYKLKPEYTDLMYYDDLIKKIVLMINKAENFADGLRGLVWKYRL